MSFDRTAVAAALAIMFFTAACGASATQAGVATPAATATSTSAGATSPAGTPAASDAAPSLTPGQAPDLEAMLPSSVNGIALTKSSFDGAKATTAISMASLDKILKDNGKSLADVREAVASTPDSAATLISVGAIQIRGVPASALLTLMAASGSVPPTSTIGGKSVIHSGSGGSVSDIYLKDDILFLVMLYTADATAVTDATLEPAILTALP